MLKIAMVIAMVYAIAWIVSTPEGRAAAKPAADKWGKRLLGVAGALIVLIMAAGMLHR